MTTKLTFGLLLSLGVATTAFAQTGRVGINTETPKTTFDVNGKKDGSGNLLTTDVTGMQAPRLTRAELTAKGAVLYGTDQKGALVYITDVTAGDALTQRINITAAGYYYFDGTVWQKITTGLADNTDDAWVNNPTNTRVELGATSTGAARPAGTEVVALDNGSVGIGTPTPVATALLDVTSTTKGFLPPRMTKVQMNAIAPTEGLVVYCTDCSPQKGLYVNNGTTFVSIGQILSADTPTPGAGEILRPTGKIWMDKNLGAASVATSSTDPASYGDLYQWGRKDDGHQIRTSATAAGPVASGSEGTTFITVGPALYDWLSTQEANRWYGVSSTNDPCPAGYRVPSDYEWQAERNTWATKNSAGAFTALKLPVAGYRDHSNGTLGHVGSLGGCWSSTVSGTNARSLIFYSSAANMDSNNRAHGFSVRCIKD